MKLTVNYPQTKILKAAISFIFGFFLIPGVAMATFSDVPSGHPDFLAVESLSRAGIINGYPDGTYKPDQKISRAEALKLIMRAAGARVDSGLYSTGFYDVPLDSWYAGYVMQAVLEKIIAGNPDGSFAGDRTVNESEFLKIMLKAFKIDLSKHVGLTVKISNDSAIGEWFIPYLSYAKMVGLIYPDFKYNLLPSKEITRGNAAGMLYKMYLIKYGDESQKYLFITEAKIIDGLVRLNLGDVAGAVFVGKEAVYYSNRAREKSGNSDAAGAANHIANAFDKMFRAYEAAADGDKDEAKKLLGEAASLSQQAVNLNKSAAGLAEKVTQQSTMLLEKIR